MANDHPWAKEPWEYEEADPLQGFIVNEEGDEITYPIVAINPKHLPRIVACVNACAGVPTEDLEQVITLGKAHYNTLQALESRYPTMSQKEFEEMVERGEAEEGKIYAVRKEPPNA